MLFRYRLTFNGLVAVVIAAAATAATAQQPSPPLTSFDPATDGARFGQLFRPYGVRPDRAATASAAGLAFDLGPRKDPGHVGVKATTALTGDFAVEVKYELVTAPERADEGYGVTIGLGVSVDSKQGGASVARGAYKQDGQQYSAGRSVPRAKGVHYASRHFPTTAKAGRLGLRRVRDEVVLLAADAPTGEWVELQRYPFPTAPVQTLSLYADTGGAAVPLKGRFYDLRLLTGAAVPTADAKKGPPGTTIVPMPNPATEPVGETAADVTAVPVTGPGSAGAGVRGWWWIPALTFVFGVAVGMYIHRVYASRTPSTPDEAQPQDGRP
jgi:hypothetical protein